MSAAANRRQTILNLLRTAQAPVAASKLAERLGVSRQIIVGDIALLRASGEAISATPRGYVLASGADPDGAVLRTVACTHSADEMGRELTAIVDAGGEVLDVIVEHPVYGQLTGQLRLSNRRDVDSFLHRVAGAGPLSSLTGGIHLHTLRAPDESTMAAVIKSLRVGGFLLSEE
ncbi:MAG: transcription repressor NadR [Oscillospiraceae bacterium]|nr:transcription repressor NadR [Oscillospiraceae bacterium]